MILTRINGEYFTASDLSCAYHRVPLSEETQKLTILSVGGKQYTYQVGFYGLCGLPQWFSRMMAINFEPLVKKKQAITYLMIVYYNLKPKARCSPSYTNITNSYEKAG